VRFAFKRGLKAGIRKRQLYDERWL